MQLSNLLAGLIGALISAGLSLIVRWFMDHRAQLQAERRIGYVHVVAVSEVLAMERLLRTYLDALGITEKFGKLGDSGGKFEASHRASVLIADAIKNAPPDTLRFPDGQAVDPRQLKRMLEALQQSKLGTDVLSRFPRGTIQLALRLQSCEEQVSAGLGLWLATINDDDRTWVSPKAIYEQWTAIGRLVDTARALRLAMIEAGVLDAAEAAALLKSQTQHLARFAFAGLLAERQLASAEDISLPSTAATAAGGQQGG